MPELFTYTGTKLATEVKNQFGDTGGIQINDDLILGWINNGQRSIASTNDFLEKTFTTNLLAGQVIYDLATLMAGQRVKSYGAVVANGRKLKYVPWSKFLVEDYGVEFGDDDPWVFTDYADQITLAPGVKTSVPSALTIYFTGWPADITALSQTLTVPDRFYNALSDYVLAQALELDENFDAAQVQLASHAQALSVEAGREQANPNDVYPIVPSMETW